MLLQLLTIPGELMLLLLVCACSKWSNDHHVLVIYLLAHCSCLLLNVLMCLMLPDRSLLMIYLLTAHACKSMLEGFGDVPDASIASWYECCCLIQLSEKVFL